MASYPYGTLRPGSYLGYISPVGSYPPNAWGLYDMHGNVSEWCQDLYADDLLNSDSLEDPVNLQQADTTRPVIRGGFWDGSPRWCRAAYRDWRAPDHGSRNIGFRCCFYLD